LILTKFLCREWIESASNGKKSGTLKGADCVSGGVTIEIAGDVKAHATKKFVQGEDVSPASTPV
jgi:hypothetical protein